MTTTRRTFLKGMAALSAGAVAPSLLGIRVVEAASVAHAAPAPSSDDITTWRMSGAHWGAFRAKVEADRVVEIRPFELDKHPTDILDGTLGVIYSPSRVRYPMIRVDWYKNRKNSNR